MRSALVIVRVLALAALAACQGYGPTTVSGGGGVGTGGGGGGGGGTGGAGVVTISDNFYSPAAITVDSGKTVTWVWAGANPHSVTFDAGGPGDSGIRVTGSITAQFFLKGTFNYHCLVHGTAMSGSVTVQ
jgi:plastocyanin